MLHLSVARAISISHLGRSAASGDSTHTLSEFFLRLRCAELELAPTFIAKRARADLISESEIKWESVRGQTNTNFSN